MKPMKIEEMIAAVQKKLGVLVDGRPGPETWGAIYSHIVKPTVAGVSPVEAIEAVDARSEKNISTLLPKVQPIARALVQKPRSMAFTSRSSVVCGPMKSKMSSMPRVAPSPDRKSPTPAADIRTAISGLPSTSGSSRGRNIFRTPSSTRPLVRWARTWGWSGAETGSPSSICRTSNSGRPGLLI
jgi:hypothetical protein